MKQRANAISNVPFTGFEWSLAWRIVRSRKSRFLSVVTVIAVLGIAFGVMALTIVLSVTGGFQDSFRQNAPTRKIVLPARFA